MKNQNDLIVAGAVVFVSIAVTLLFFFTQREPTKFPEPVPVVTADAAEIQADVVMSDSLSGGGTQQGFGGPQQGGVGGRMPPTPGGGQQGGGRRPPSPGGGGGEDVPMIAGASGGG